MSRIDEHHQPELFGAKPLGTAADARFDIFWQAYRRNPNMSKADTRKAWDRAIRVADPDQIMQGLIGFNKWLDHPKQKDHPVCHASTWLNQARWEGFLELGAVPGPVDLQAVLRGTPQWEAWIRFYQAQGRHKDRNASYLDRLTVPGEWPPETTNPAF